MSPGRGAFSATVNLIAYGLRKCLGNMHYSLSGAMTSLPCRAAYATLRVEGRRPSRPAHATLVNKLTREIHRMSTLRGMNVKCQPYSVYKYQTIEYNNAICTVIVYKICLGERPGMSNEDVCCLL